MSEFLALAEIIHFRDLSAASNPELTVLANMFGGGLVAEMDKRRINTVLSGAYVVRLSKGGPALFRCTEIGRTDLYSPVGSPIIANFIIPEANIEHPRWLWCCNPVRDDVIAFLSDAKAIVQALKDIDSEAIAKQSDMSRRTAIYSFKLRLQELEEELNSELERQKIDFGLNTPLRILIFKIRRFCDKPQDADSYVKIYIRKLRVQHLLKEALADDRNALLGFNKYERAIFQKSFDEIMEIDGFNSRSANVDLSTNERLEIKQWRNLTHE